MSRYDGPADERRTPFDEQLAALLARTADASQPSPDLARQVRQALTASSPTPRRFHFAMPSLAGLAGPALVAALLAVFVAVFAAHGWVGGRPGGVTAPQQPQHQGCVSSTFLPSNPPMATQPVDHSVALGESATRGGVTITLVRGYADAVSTIVTYVVTPSADAGAHASQVMLTDNTTGAHYLPLTQTSYSPAAVDTLIFPPLPQAQLGSPHRLSVSIQNLDVTSASVPPGTENQTLGTWIIPFSLTPVTGQAIRVTAPPQTHDGVTVTLEELDVAPVGGGLAGIAGGVRARYKISGLDPTTTLDTALEYPVTFSGADGSGQGMAPGGWACANRLTLRLANSLTLLPGFITVDDAYAPANTFAQIGGNATLTVGASGAVEAQALFYLPATPQDYAPALPGNVTFAINTISITEGHASQAAFIRNAQGPWSFTTRLP